jgi:translation initiation factor 2-alpha kinase 4
MDSPEYTPMFEVVQEKLTAIFRLHGAMNSEPPILTPVLNPSENPEDTLLLDKRGQVVSLASDGLEPFAREAKRKNYDRIKRFQFLNVYRPK